MLPSATISAPNNSLLSFHIRGRHFGAVDLQSFATYGLWSAPLLLKELLDTSTNDPFSAAPAAIISSCDIVQIDRTGCAEQISHNHSYQGFTQTTFPENTLLLMVTAPTASMAARTIVIAGANIP
jgi:hypothetical protein